MVDADNNSATESRRKKGHGSWHEILQTEQHIN